MVDLAIPEFGYQNPYWRRPPAPAIVRANELIRCFRSAKTCSVWARMAGLVVFAPELRTGIGRWAGLLAVDAAHQHEFGDFSP